MGSGVEMNVWKMSIKKNSRVFSLFLLLLSAAGRDNIVRWGSDVVVDSKIDRDRAREIKVWGNSGSTKNL